MKNTILIIGAGEAGRQIYRELKKRKSNYEIKGFVDDNDNLLSDEFIGSKILGKILDIEKILVSNNITNVIIAMPSVEYKIVYSLVDRIVALNKNILVNIVPSVERYFESFPIVPVLKNFDITDLFEKNLFHFDMPFVSKKFTGKTVLITGAGGSIGSEICRQLLKFDIKKLIAIGRGEFSIYQLIKSLNEYTSFLNEKPDIEYKIINVKDYRLMEKLFASFQIDIVFHAAAHKHVPLMEYNEVEALQNNVLGTKNVLELSAIYGVSEFVLVSTDKAVRPLNIMGATKRLAELVTGYYNKYKNLKTAIVRFGNVIGSRGSALPLFKEQIENGGPVTITHPEVKRFFMSIPEAALLVLNSTAYSNGGEIFVLEMGEQHYVLDIAKKMIELYGYRFNEDIKIEFTGLRPGEKLSEELFYDMKMLQQTTNNKILYLKRDNKELDTEEFNLLFKKIEEDLIDFSTEEIRSFIKQFVPEFDWDDNYLKKENNKKMIN